MRKEEDQREGKKPYGVLTNRILINNSLSLTFRSGRHDRRDPRGREQTAEERNGGRPKVFFFFGSGGREI